MKGSFKHWTKDAMDQLESIERVRAELQAAGLDWHIAMNVQQHIQANKMISNNKFNCCSCGGTSPINRHPRIVICMGYIIGFAYRRCNRCFKKNVGGLTMLKRLTDG